MTTTTTRPTPTEQPESRPFITAFGKVRCERCHDFGAVQRDEYPVIGRASDGSPVHGTHAVRRLYRCPCGQGWGTA